MVNYLMKLVQTSSNVRHGKASHLCQSTGGSYPPAQIVFAGIAKNLTKELPISRLALHLFPRSNNRVFTTILPRLIR